ncbi:MAG: HEPN domain-containing protein [Deltaproteobacteria bacterium]|nr:HEPN domain-containing protein [Deltaproteobacteria bacterium]
MRKTHRELQLKGLHTLLIDDNFPRIHDLNKLYSFITDKFHSPLTEDFQSFFDDLSIYYIDSRYVEYKRELYLNLNKENARLILTKTEEVFKWLMTLAK